MPTMKCPSGLVLEMRKIKGREIVALASTAESESVADTSMASLVGACWEGTTDAGPYPYVVAGTQLAPPWLRLLKGDVLFLFIELRRISLLDGEIYSPLVTCEACKRSYGWDVPLSELPKLELPAESVARMKAGQLFDTTLPSGAVVQFDLQKTAQETEIINLLKMQHRNGGTVIDTLAAQIVKVDGRELTIKERSEFVQDLGLDEVTTLQEAFEAVDCGIDTEIVTICKHCGHRQAIALPLAKGFFQLSRTKKKKREVSAGGNGQATGATPRG